MRIIAAAAAVSGTLILGLGHVGNSSMFDPIRVHENWARSPSATLLEGSLASPSPEELTDVVETYCVRCHSDRRLRGNLSLEEFDVESAAEMAPTAERMIRKLRAGMMPPAGANRPEGDTLLNLVETLERSIDEAAERQLRVGSRVFQRLNQAEYESSIQDMLGLEVDAGEYLPEDTKSANFDNIADAQLLSATLMSAYLNAASEVARLAVGDPDAVSKETMYRIPRLTSQTTRAEGAPYGSRGGISVIHNFPADGTYDFRMMFHYSPEGILFGRNEPGEQVEVSIDGTQVALLPLDRFTSEADPGGKGLIVETGPITVSAGPKRVSAVFIPTERGPVDDLFSAHGFSIPDTQIGIGYGLNMPPHMRDLTVRGPENVTGVSDNPVRRGVFTCRPTRESETRGCAEDIIVRLGERAYRRSLAQIDVDALMSFYNEGQSQGGFEFGIRRALEAMLASPHFVFKVEEMPEGVSPGETYRLADADLASRLSFFIWSKPPDQELLELARKDELSKRGILEAQAKRLLMDQRSEAIATRFAAQWLRLSDLYKLDPDVQLYPDYDLGLGEAMQRETEIFFDYLVREDRPVMEILTADYTFVNERLANHYDIPGVFGNEFRRVTYPDDRRHGILGHGSVLALTSLANRTSPVNRGKWVSEVLLGAPPPPPPPGVPSLDEAPEESSGEEGGSRLLSTRERMEQHRQNPTCNSCHRLIDPIGLALDHFDVTGAWRIKENGTQIDVRGEFYDGTEIESASDLTAVLSGLEIPILRNFTANLMAYALGRRIEYYDMPQIRKIVSDAEEEGYRISSFILGVIESDAFQMRQATIAGDDTSLPNSPQQQ